MIQWPGGRERWRKQGEQLHTFFPPQKIFVCLETKASRQEGFGWNQTFSPPWPLHVIYSSCWSKLCPESPRTCKAAAANSAAAQDTVLCRALAWPHSSAGAHLSETSAALPSVGDPISSLQPRQLCIIQQSQHKRNSRNQEGQRPELYRFWSFVCSNAKRLQKEKPY